MPFDTTLPHEAFLDLSSTLDINRSFEPKEPYIKPCIYNCNRKKCMFCGSKLRRSHVLFFIGKLKQREKDNFKTITFTITKKGSPEKVKQFIRKMRVLDEGIEYITVTEFIPNRHIHGILSTKSKIEDIKSTWAKVGYGTYIKIKHNREPIELWLNYITKQGFNLTNAPLEQRLSKIQNSKVFAYHGKKAKAERREWVMEHNLQYRAKMEAIKE